MTCSNNYKSWAVHRDFIFHQHTGNTRFLWTKIESILQVQMSKCRLKYSERILYMIVHDFNLLMHTTGSHTGNQWSHSNKHMGNNWESISINARLCTEFTYDNIVLLCLQFDAFIKRWHFVVVYYMSTYTNMNEYTSVYSLIIENITFRSIAFNMYVQKEIPNYQIIS